MYKIGDRLRGICSGDVFEVKEVKKVDGETIYNLYNEKYPITVWRERELADNFVVLLDVLGKD